MKQSAKLDWTHKGCRVEEAAAMTDEDELKLPVLARDEVRRRLRKHPDIRKHIAIKSIIALGDAALLALAEKLDIDTKAIVAETIKGGEVEWEKKREHRDYSYKWPAFKGELEFDMSFEFLGQKVTRKAKVTYEHTPEWEYFDVRKRAPHVGSEHTMYHLEIQAVPQEYHDEGPMTLGEPYWVEMPDLLGDDVLPHEVWEPVIDAINEKCKAEDARRRLEAAPPAGTA